MRKYYTEYNYYMSEMERSGEFSTQRRAIVYGLMSLLGIACTRYLPKTTDDPRKEESTAVSQELDPKIKEYLKTGQETVLFNLIQVITEISAKKFGIPTGNANLEFIRKEIEEHPGSLFVIGGLIAPPIEEVLYRLTPSILFDRTGNGMRWDIGVGSSIVFAASHNRDSITEN